MAITYVHPETVHNERQMLRALLHHYDWRANACFCNVHLLAWESDMLVVSASRYVTEVEVKTSWADWKADAEKDKWGALDLDRYWGWVKRFTYAVPKELYDKHGVPDNLRPEHGVIIISPRKHGHPPKTEIIRPALVNTKAKPLTYEKLHQLYRSAYFKLTTRLAAGT